MKNDYVRGAISGLGIVNVFAGLVDLAPLFAARQRHETTDLHDMP